MTPIELKQNNLAGSGGAVSAVSEDPADLDELELDERNRQEAEEFAEDWKPHPLRTVFVCTCRKWALSPF